MNFKEVTLAPGLYFVATPIGSARDISLRALDVLAAADMIAAEDTRTARKLMDIHAIPLDGRKVVSFHDHSDTQVISGLIGYIERGHALAYVAEAGTPLIADPGFELGQAAIAAGITVTAAPGASAVLAALSVSGLATDRFAFLGFLPPGRTQRQAEIAGLRDLAMTLVIYESPKRVHGLLDDLCEVLGGERQAVVCRELTKRFEEVRRGPLRQLADEFGGRTVKGEIVVLVGRAGAVTVADDDLEGALRAAMQTMRIKDAATAVAGAMGLPRRQVYQMALKMGQDDQHGME